jgi:hypothetical protein
MAYRPIAKVSDHPEINLPGGLKRVWWVILPEIANISPNSTEWKVNCDIACSAVAALEELSRRRVREGIVRGLSRGSAAMSSNKNLNASWIVR